MAEYIVTPLASLENQTSAIATINENFEEIKDVLDEALSRTDDTAPNYLTVNLDLNNHRITNLGPPQAAADAVRWLDITGGFYLTGYPVPSIVGNSGKHLVTDGSTIYWAIGGSGDLVSTNNLSELTDDAAARSNLGLGSVATYNVGVGGNTIPVLNGNQTWTGDNTHQAPVTFSGGTTLNGSADVRLSVAGRTSLAADSVGYLGAPQVVRDTDFVFTLDEAGKGISHTSASGHTWTIPTNTAVAFPLHTQIALDNSGSGVVSVVPSGGVTLRSNGSSVSGTKTLNQYFVQVLYKVATDTWVWL